jgi:hypothetical protein
MRKVSREMAISMILQIIVANIQMNGGSCDASEDMCKRLEEGFVGYKGFSDEELENEYNYLTNKIAPFKIEKPAFRLERDIEQINRYYFTVHAENAEEAEKILDQCIDKGEMPSVFQQNQEGNIKCTDRTADC